MITREQVDTQGAVHAEEMHKHRLEALAQNIKSHTRLRNDINAS